VDTHSGDAYASSNSNTKYPKTKSSTTSKEYSPPSTVPQSWPGSSPAPPPTPPGDSKSRQRSWQPPPTTPTDQDTVTRFLEEACQLGGGDQVQVKVAIIRTAYERWCLEAGEQSVTPKAFGLALGRAGVESHRTMNARLYQGITLLASDDAPPLEPDDEPDSGWYR